MRTMMEWDELMYV